MARGIFRLWLVLCAIWLAVAAWMYSTGLDRDYNAHGNAEFAEETMPPEEVARLPRIDEVEKKYASLDANWFLDWEGYWIYLTRGAVPDLYERRLDRELCQHIRVRNFSNAVLYYRTTCRTRSSFSGVFCFVLIPMVVLGVALLLLVWVVKGFKSTEALRAG